MTRSSATMDRLMVITLLTIIPQFKPTLSAENAMLGFPIPLHRRYTFLCPPHPLTSRRSRLMLY